MNLGLLFIPGTPPRTPADAAALDRTNYYAVARYFVRLARYARLEKDAAGEARALDRARLWRERARSLLRRGPAAGGPPC